LPSLSQLDFYDLSICIYSTNSGIAWTRFNLRNFVYL